MRTYVVTLRSKVIVQGDVCVEASSPRAAINKARRIADLNEGALSYRDEACARFEALSVEVFKEENETPSAAHGAR